MRTRDTWFPALAAAALLAPVGCDDPIAGKSSSSAPLATEQCLETMLDEDTSPGDPAGAEERPEVDLDEGALATGEATPVVAARLPYSTHTTYRIEDIRADFWDDSYLDADPGRARNDLYQHDTGRVALNMYWHEWQPFPRSWDANAQCPRLPGDAPDTVWAPYEGSCFRIDNAFDEQLREHSANNVAVTGILDAAPDWAISPSCPLPADRKKFCAPTTAAVAEFGKLAGMLARRYNGTPGIGRIADFVIHNEINAGVWFSIGCGSGSSVGCKFDQWVSTYADSDNAAYDQIMKHQSEARVLIPLTHHFTAANFDHSEDYDPGVSTRRFLHLFALKRFKAGIRGRG